MQTPARSIQPSRKPCSSISIRCSHEASPPRGSSSLSSSRKTRPPSASALASPPPTHHTPASGSLMPLKVLRRSELQSTASGCRPPFTASSVLRMAPCNSRSLPSSVEVPFALVELRPTRPLPPLVGLGNTVDAVDHLSLSVSLSLGVRRCLTTTIL
jgi:hypothetical protein